MLSYLGFYYIYKTPWWGQPNKRKHLIWDDLQFQRFSVLSSWPFRQIWFSRKLEFYTLISSQQKKTMNHIGCNLNIWDIKICPQSDPVFPPRMHLLIITTTSNPRMHSGWAKNLVTWVYWDHSYWNHYTCHPCLLRAIVQCWFWWFIGVKSR